MTTVRICVCGDTGVGKSSLIACFVKDTFISGKIQSVLPQVTIPPTIAAPEENITTVIVDTSALPQQRDVLNQEIRKANVILLVYSAPDHYSYERLGLFWLPHFRSLGVNVPVVLVAAKSDLVTGSSNPTQTFEEEVLPLMSEFKEVDTCVRTSSRERLNANEAVYLCQKAVIHPVSPLYDSKEFSLKPAAVQALKRVFWLADKDKDQYLSDRELEAFQSRCFGKALEATDITSVKNLVQGIAPESVTERGVDEAGFLILNKYFAEKGRHETVWIILRAYHYSDSLNLRESFIHPKFEVPAHASAELSPAGYQFLFDLFLLFDKDNDGGLNDAELAALFYPTPGLPASWNDFPSSTVRNEAGDITLQGWLAQWSMTTFSAPKTTLEYLALLGFEPSDQRSSNAAALKVTKPRKRKRNPGKVDRNVVHAYIVGAAGAGKSSLLDAFLARPFANTYHPTIKPRVAVNSVELPGGKQCYLILEELGELELAVMENSTRLESCDLVLYAYDSSSPDSFEHLLQLRERHRHLEGLPGMFIALKADHDRTTQRAEVQPDEYCAKLGMAKPLHVSVTWQSVSELFVSIAETALKPTEALPREEGKTGDDWTGAIIGVSAAVAVGAAGVAIWRRTRNE